MKSFNYTRIPIKNCYRNINGVLHWFAPDFYYHGKRVINCRTDKEVGIYYEIDDMSFIRMEEPEIYL